jgi:deoxyribodipyrimidine photolyase
VSHGAPRRRNTFNWLGLAGVAPWSPPYFRVYSPTPDPKKSSLNVDDAAGAFVDRFVPELRRLPAKYKYAPWTAPKADLRAAGVALGDTYPRPIVDHKVASKANVARFKAAAARARAARPKADASSPGRKKAKL